MTLLINAFDLSIWNLNNYIKEWNQNKSNHIQHFFQLYLNWYINNMAN